MRASVQHGIRLFFAALMFPALTTSCHAAVIYSGIQDIPISTNFDGVYLDVDTGAHNSSVITGWDINPFFGGVGIANSAAFQPVRSGTDIMDAILNLPYGTLVSAASTFATGEGGSETHLGSDPGQLGIGDEGCIGFQFTTNSSAGPYYGWMRVTLTANTSGAFIHDWAYDDTGGAVLAGSLIAAPEPSRVLFLVLGLVIATMRRRR